MADYKFSYVCFSLVFLTNLLLSPSVFSQGPASFIDQEAVVYQLTHPQIFLFRNECYKDIGCFYNGPPYFDATSRPFSVPPQDCEKTLLPLFTPSNAKESYNFTLNATSIENSPYNCDLPTIVISHGFLANNKAYRKMKDKILSIGDYNIIVPDYPDYVIPPYFQAVANIRAIGVRVAILIELLMDYCNYRDASSFHLIGHSLGAQLSGYAAKHLGEKVGRISGLDVAGPYFQGAPEETRLTTKDADFVDAIHTNAAKSVAEVGFGMYDIVGHIDFWVNNGYTQPGCDAPQSVVRDKGINFTHVFVTVGCSHTRATEVYTESVIPTDCVFRGIKCDSYDDFREGKCPEERSPVAEMGFHSKKNKNFPANSTFYLETNAYKSYCKKDGTKPFSSSNPFVNMYDRFFG